MLAIGMFCSWCVYDIVVWSNEAEAYDDGHRKGEREGNGGKEGVGAELLRVSMVICTQS